MSLQARPYQQEAVKGVLAAWFGQDEPAQNVLGIAPTGAGKTVMFNMIIREVLNRFPRARIVVMAHRKELLIQGQAKFHKFIGEDVSTGIVQADLNECMAQVVFASKDTIRQPKRLAALLGWGKVDVLITDEAHHAEAETYKRITGELRSVNPDMLHLGVTATPERGDGKGLGAVYQKIAFRLGLKDLIPAYLVPPRWLGIKTGISLKGVKVQAGDYVASQLTDVYETPQCLDLVVKSHQTYAHDDGYSERGRPFVAFTVSVAGAHELAEKFTAAGYRVAAIDGTMAAEQRARILADYDSGVLDGLCNCAVLTEGWDAPRIAVVHMVRPTKSNGFYLQMIGRGLRPRNGHQPEPGENCLILEYAPANTRNLSNFGRVLDVPEEQIKRLEKADEALEGELAEELDVGDVLGALTFDGQMEMGIGAEGLEVIARELNYLEASPWAWTRQEGWFLLSLGMGKDDIKRILAISPEREGGIKTLYAIFARPNGEYNERGYPKHGPWQCVAHRHDDDHDALMEFANGLAERNGAPALIDKTKAPRWMKAPASDGQRKMIKKAFPADAKRADLTSGEASELITLMQARDVLTRAGAWEVEAAHGVASAE